MEVPVVQAQDERQAVDSVRSEPLHKLRGTLSKATLSVVEGHK